MAVEILGQGNSGEILDLTKGAKHEEEVTNPTDEIVDTEGAGTDVDTEEPETGSSDDVLPDAADGSGDEDEQLEGEFFFGEDKVDVSVPDEIKAALDEAGIDSNELVKQLFKKDGDFSLDEDTRTKLEEKFGKHMVSGYLSMYKNMNEQSLAKGKAEQEAQSATLEQQGKQYADVVGGEEGLVALENYVLDNLDENQISAYNSVMEHGDHSSQMLVISQLKKTMELADKLKNGDKKLDLIGDKETGSLVSSPIDKGFLTNEEFNKIMEDDKYWTDRNYMSKVDNARMAGKRLGK